MNGLASLRRCVVGVVSLTLAGAVSSCGVSAGSVVGSGGLVSSQAPAPTGELVIVAGAHSNAPPPALLGAAANARDLAVGQRSHVSLVVADGAPYAIDVSGPPVGRGVTGGDPGATQGVDGRHIDEAVAAARAKTPESDLLAAMDLAGRSLRERQGLRTLVVVDSGLSTTGALDFRTPGLLDADPQDVATTLADSRLLPDLTGVAVVFQGLGETASPQQPLSRARRTEVDNIWTAVAKRAGAVLVQVEDPAVPGGPAANLPPVTPVAMDPGYACNPKRMVLNGGSTAFKPNSKEFLDPQAALEVLRPVVEQALASNIPAVMLGTAAAVGDPGQRRKLSEDRAQTVANVFISLGVPTSQLKVEGLGSTFSGFIPDHDAFDRVIPAAAAINRKVIIDFGRPIRCP